MKERVIVRIVSYGGDTVVMFTVTGEGGRCGVHTNVTQSSGLRLVRLVETYRTDYSLLRMGESGTQLKVLLEEVR